MLRIILLASVLVSVIALDDGSCITPASEKGQCVQLEQCKVLWDLVNKPTGMPEEMLLLQRSKCYEDDLNTVCCPLKTNKCTTPDGYAGTCVIPHLCPRFVKALRDDLDLKEILFYLRSRCDLRPITLCCKHEPTPSTSPRPVPTRASPIGASPKSMNTVCSEQQTAFPPDPKTRCCGYDASIGNKIVGGNSTFLDQYPWMALIEYKLINRPRETALLCAGVLISGRYVLTAAHCIYHESIKKIAEPKLVRLGEYNTSNDGPDCAEVEADGLDCTDGAIWINVERTISHPKYNISNHKNDVGLIRMASMAPYTDFIRPICLPTSDITINPPPNFMLTAVGWGSTGDKSSSNIKLHVGLPFVNLQECQSRYNGSNIKANLWDYQFCAGGEVGKDTCKGDSGGPLVYENEKIYEVIGIVSFGPYPCAEQNIPGVYTKVNAYRDWIFNTIME